MNYLSSNEIAKETGLSPVTAEILSSKEFSNIKDLTAFLHPQLEDLLSPYLMMDMDKAVARILQAIKKKERIVIFGDYDVDGITGSFLLWKMFEYAGVEVDIFVPNRFTDGYGLTIESLKKLIGSYDLAISTDCGINAREAISFAQANNLEVIVTDHHLPNRDEFPEKAVAVLNPLRADCEYPCKSLTGVSVAFKLAQAILEQVFPANQYFLKKLLPFAAIGTVADMAVLTGEARTIVKLGFDNLMKTDNLGLREMIELAQIQGAVGSYDIGFKIAPRINAAGRMESGEIVLDLLKSTNLNEANQLAHNIEELNDKRRELQNEIYLQAVNQLTEKYPEDLPAAIVVGSEHWHQGVIGIVAAKLVEEFQRPAIVLAIDATSGIAKGSGRSCGEFSLIEALHSTADLFITYGGHEQACGMTVKAEHLVKLSAALDNWAGSRQAQIAARGREEIYEIDIEDINLKLVDELARLEPFGRGNNEPLFKTKAEILAADVLKKKYLKLKLFRETTPLTAMQWKVKDVIEVWHQTAQYNFANIIFTIQDNTWQNIRTEQIIIQDLSLTEED